MPARLRLIITLHNHQPVGNFGQVFEEAYRDSYEPFLDVLQEFPELKIVLHNSGSLLEWLEAHRPQYIDRLRSFVKSGQVEILGGPFYEPILAAIPQVDRYGQIVLYQKHLEKLFETRVRGMWMPERVWEPSFAGDLAQAGMEYTLLDDAHFRQAGLTDERLQGYYLTEDGGRIIKVFCGSEQMRYLIPYADPHEVIARLRGIAEQRQNSVVVFGDDGEKFGVWPGSQAHVYGQSQWLRRFFTALRENGDWLTTTTMAETADHVPPLGRIYIPESSYREMTEWALPADRQADLKAATSSFEHHSEWPRLRPYVRAGFWRNFLVKYPEANEMYSRMLHVSRMVDQLSQQPQFEVSVPLAQARRELYRAQCNCSYWHGAFGGLYLPHLRNAVYGHLIAADNALQMLQGRKGRWVHIETADFNLDARNEILISTDRLNAFFCPSRGGHLYELDVRSIRHNLAATLNRRPEPYHERIRQHQGNANTTEGGGVDPNGGVRFKQPDLDQKLNYDRWPRKMLVDHFLQPRLSMEQFAQGNGELGDFPESVYQTALRRRSDQADVRMTRTGRVGPFEVTLSKTVSVSHSLGGVLKVDYQLEKLPAGLPIHFAVEFNFAGMAAQANDRYYYNQDGRQLGPLESRHELVDVTRVGLVDEWLGLDVSLETSTPGGLWLFPIQTVSQSGRWIRTGTPKLCGGSALGLYGTRGWALVDHVDADAGYLGSTGPATLATSEGLGLSDP